MTRIAAAVLMVVVVALAGLAGWSMRAAGAAPAAPKLDTPYQAVLLTNGQRRARGWLT